MKNATPILVARYIALLIAVLFFLILAGFRFFDPDSVSWMVILIFTPASGIITYIVLYFILERFIYRKIKLIYKTIYDTRIPSDEKQVKSNLRKDVIKDAENEVLIWQQEKLKESHRKKRMEQFRKEFLANVFHELKTPVFNIQGYLETLIEGGIEDHSVNQKFLRKARENVKRMTEMVDELQMISNLEDGSFFLSQERFDIYQLAKEVIENHEIRARKKNIRLEFKEGCDTSFIVNADREMIYQVFDNLVSNSINYGRMNGKTHIGLYDMNENILVEISDNGIGIEQKHLPRIFERFYRVDKARSRQAGGSGLGLAIVKHIIEAHHQSVNVRSTPGLGTTFGFTLRKA
jgi:two-component system, OmpR family, phosphate regulon sensor histidine kinase PhoR